MDPQIEGDGRRGTGPAESLPCTTGRKSDNLMFVLKQKRKTVRDITMAVYEFMVKENIQERLQRTEEEFQKAGELALAKEYSQVYRIIIELFDKFVELLGEEPVGLNEYCKLLDAGLEEARVGVIPQVWIR